MSGRLVHLLRHGPPLRAGLLLGHTDEPPADPAGGLAGAVPDRLALSGVTSSDLRRARAGAQALAERRGVTLTVDARWRELDFGAWDGLAPEQAPADALARFWDDPEGCPPPGGERWSALRARVADALAALPGDALAVTHGGAMRAAVSIVTGLDFRQVWALDLPYGALLGLRIWEDGQCGQPSGQIVSLHAGGTG
jgi:alpha-ribazole phosphatase